MDYKELIAKLTNDNPEYANIILGHVGGLDEKIKVLESKPDPVLTPTPTQGKAVETVPPSTTQPNDTIREMQALKDAIIKLQTQNEEKDLRIARKDLNDKLIAMYKEANFVNPEYHANAVINDAKIGASGEILIGGSLANLHIKKLAETTPSFVSTKITIPQTATTIKTPNQSTQDRSAKTYTAEQIKGMSPAEFKAAEADIMKFVNTPKGE